MAEILGRSVPDVRSALEVLQGNGLIRRVAKHYDGAMTWELPAPIDRVFRMAAERGFDLDWPVVAVSEGKLRIRRLRNLPRLAGVEDQTVPHYDFHD